MRSEDRAREEGKGFSLPADVLQTELPVSVPRLWLPAKSERDRGGEVEKNILISTVYPESYLKLN